jgi:hypothetical protein
MKRFALHQYFVCAQLKYSTEILDRVLLMTKTGEPVFEGQ